MRILIITIHGLQFDFYLYGRKGPMSSKRVACFEWLEQPSDNNLFLGYMINITYYLSFFGWMIDVIYFICWNQF
jgi:hypothetical protein